MITHHKLYAPFRYSMVENDVYRGGYPKQRNYTFLQKLGLKTILSLTKDPPTAEFLAFCFVNKITSIHVQVDKPKDNVPLTYPKVSSILALIIDPDNLPIYIHCLDGTVVTGMELSI